MDQATEKKLTGCLEKTRLNGIANRLSIARGMLKINIYTININKY